jgi:hypothetical protein
VTAGTALSRQRLAGQQIQPQLIVAPQQVWDWHAFKSKCGPTYAGSTGGKHYTDFLVSRVQEYGAVDLEYIEIPYDHYVDFQQ